jgi:hypothetical protein
MSEMYFLFEYQPLNKVGYFDILNNDLCLQRNVLLNR